MEILTQGHLWLAGNTIYADGFMMVSTVKPSARVYSKKYESPYGQSLSHISSSISNGLALPPPSAGV